MQRAYLYLVAATLLWSGNFVIGRATHTSIGPLTLSTGRWLLVAILLGPIAFKAIVKVGWNREQWLKIGFMSLLCVSFYNTLIYIGLQYTAAPNGVLYNSTIPFYIIAINWLIFQSEFNFKEFAGIVLSVIGVCILITQGQIHTLLELNFSKGDLWIITAAVIWALYTALLPHWRPEQLSGLEFLAVMTALGMIPIIIARIINPFNETAFEWSQANVSAIIYVAVAASVMSFYFFNEGVNLIGPEKAGQSIHLMPLFVSILAYLLLDESLYFYHLFGAVFILAGLILANKLTLFKPKKSVKSDKHIHHR